MASHQSPSFFYSEQLTYCECIMPRQIGWQVINELGELETVHFVDSEINYNSHFVKNLKRCDDAVGKINDINNFINEIKKKYKQIPVSSYRNLLAEFKKQIAKQKIHGYLYFNQIEDEVINVHTYFVRQKKQLEGIERDLHDKIIKLALLKTLLKSKQFNNIVEQKNLLAQANLFDYKCVIINRKDQVQLEKGLFRISRGHCWVKTFQIDEMLSVPDSPVSEKYQFLKQKMACMLIFEFGENSTLLNKINRYLTCLEITGTDTPVNKWKKNIDDLQKQIKQIHHIQNLTKESIQRYLYKLYQPYNDTSVSLLTYLQAYTLKERDIYRKLAAMTESKNFLHFNIFVPTKQLPLRVSIPEKLPPLTLTSKIPRQSPPTKFPQSTIMEYPQQILNTYGVPSYHEMNPAPLYIVTFAFFIGVMFGDIGHMLMAIPWLLYFKVNVWVWIVVFFMGYCGLIYGEFLGLPFAIFDSCFQIPALIFGQQDIPIKAARNEDCVYPLGIDPIWKIAQNQMQFTNSFKMKLAVILGVTHMMLGLAIKLVNYIRAKKHLEIFTIGIPQLVFMTCTFVYMDFLIIYKWGSDYTYDKSKQAPSIIATMISVFAGFGDSQFLFWPDQRKFEKALVIIAYLMIPIMLLGVPIATWLSRKREFARLKNKAPKDEHGEFNDLVDEKISDDADSGGGSEQAMSDRTGYPSKHKNAHQKQALSEVVVHSFIETIEYVLGTVSNTASYLRLWALSLAHGQLSEVIFDLILKQSVAGGYKKIALVFFAFMFYYAVTFGVLICMDSMECFLHALRLHWVEFQNKFYEGKGYKFQPFAFKSIYTHSAS